ncbi:MerR family transcriptional regulator [Paenibacillus sp. DXFW5]|uniref:MerR family transcriptional regulator n=1 Tax=Paenibacillus rhizolycopersici TaxID=2780073 RepID=A0ABS2H979_9BACL|nr:MULTISPECIES: MerR family transcriptional regulator [Paenibacillus]MBM6996339.1 MerR family transcriptional regulator [Paenibacillus rhizolycopersici]MUG86218.1 MerR family transcriptional regulator [Paenibacillus timonensis]GIP50612.1 MerR family transcriptional regulator [Paenibacillus sp. J53TS2]
MMNIKEVTLMTGITASTLRYYETEGLLPFVKRDDNGKRLYDQEDLEWVHFVTALRLTGMPIVQIQKYVRLFHEGDETIAERKKMMLEHKGEIEKKISELYRNLDKINYKLALYDVLEAQINNTDIKI